MSGGGESQYVDHVGEAAAEDPVEISVLGMTGSAEACILVDSSTTVANVAGVLEERCGIPRWEIRVLVEQRLLGASELILPALAGRDLVLRILRVVPSLEWGLHESSGSTVEGPRFSKTSDNPDYSMVLSKEMYSEGVHEFTFKCVSEAAVKSGTFLGITSPDADLARSVDDGTARAFYYWSGGQLRDNGGGLNILKDDLPSVSAVGETVTVHLDCENNRIVFSVNGLLIGSVDNLPQECGPWHVFICCDFVPDAWELLPPE